MNQVILLYIPLKSKPEAIALAGALLHEGLIACANVLPGITSLYRWEGQMQQEDEVLLIAKTTPERQQAAIARAEELHGYDCPCILALPTVGGNAAFVSWVAAALKD